LLRIIKMKNKGHIIKSIEPGSIAEEMGLDCGDEVLSINGKIIEDVFDYHYLMDDDYIELGIKKADGEEWVLEIDKEHDEDLGITFENGLMDSYRSCSNQCMFCFIDQMPRGMRDTLYFKDDDSRLSFLQGNYVTLTNMSDHDIDRIIQYHLAPINISFHTTNPILRCKMLHNRFAGDIFMKVKRLYDAGIEMNGQIVLCKGVNDKEELEKSIQDLSGFLPHLRSISVVPVGLTRYRDGLYPLEAFTRDDAEQVLNTIHKWQEKLYPKYGIHFVYASDEWYILAGRELPSEETYDGYLQYENGVGMLRLLETEIEEEMSQRVADARTRDISIATGALAAPFIKEYTENIRKIYPGIHVKVFSVANIFFGESITVSGLLTGQDIKNQLKGQSLGEKLLIPCNMLRQGENVFLDDMTVEELEEALGVPILVVDEPGKDFVRAVADKDAVITHRRRIMYEQTDCSDSGSAKCR